MKYRKELVANIAIVLLVLTLATAKADETTSDDQQTATPNTIPADSNGSDSTDRDGKQKGSAESDDDADGENENSKAGEQCHFWGNSYSLKFHLKSCPFAQAMNPRHVQFLNNAREALKLGEKPCRYCLPPYTLDVSCKILARPVNHNQSDNSAERKAPENGI